MNKDVNIFLATDENVDDIVSIMLSNVELYDQIMPGAFNKYAASIAEHGIPKTYVVEMIEYDNKVVGFIGTIEIKEDIIYLLALYLQNEHQNKGIGKFVIETLKSTYLTKNKREIVLLAHKDAHWASHFYEKNGFRHIGDNQEFISNYADKALENHYIKNSVLYSLKLR